MKIVVADDSRAMRMIVLRNLRQGGFADSTFFEAENGKEAYDIIQAEKPELCLSDWNMPEMNGLELLESLDLEALGLLFGFVTTETTAEMRDLAIENGAKFLIAKPFTPEVFQDTINDALKEASQ